MSEDCSHKCDNCQSKGHCSKEIEKLKTYSLNKINKIIGIVSGKGGVGKSFVTSILASKLNKLGYKVGVLDGDITGPSIPKGFGIHDSLEGDGESLIFPYVTKSNIKIVSSNLLLSNEEDPIIWRGSLVSSLLTQFYTNVYWGELDYLLIDMPPGTSDVTLTSFQSIPLNGILIVSTPQDLVSLIVKKAIHMANTLNVNIIGLIENMSYITCPDCHKKIYIFGDSELKSSYKDLNIKLLARLPLNSNNSILVDEGRVEEIDVNEINEVIKELENV